MADGDGASMQVGNPVKAAIGEQKRNAKSVIVAAQVHNGQLARGRRQMRNCARAWDGRWQVGHGKGANRQMGNGEGTNEQTCKTAMTNGQIVQIQWPM